MQPKLKGDTSFTPVDDGVIVRNNQGSCMLHGKAISRWIESLAPYLNGDHTLAEITAGLDAERVTLVTDLMNILLARGFVRDTSQDLPHHLTPRERETYATELALIDAYTDSACARFERFREHQVLLIGSGLSLTELVHACLKSGLRQPAVLTTRECETETRHSLARGFTPQVDLFHEDDPQQSLREINAPQWEDEAQVLATLQPFDTIVHVSDRPMLARASLLNRLCMTEQKNLLQAILIEDRAWIGPLVRGQGRRDSGLPLSVPKGCWECAWRRLQGNLTNLPEQWSAYAFADQTTCEASLQATSRFLAPPTGTHIAHLLSTEVLKALTEAGPVETLGHLIEVDLSTLHAEKHPFLPHPLCQACSHGTPRTQAQFRETIEHLEQGELLDPDLFAKRVAPCVESRLGLFRSLDEGEIPPRSISIIQAVVSNPVPEIYRNNLPATLGLGVRFGTALRQGAKRACEVYASCAVDQRRLFGEQMAADDARIGAVGAIPCGRPVPTISAERFLCEVPLSQAREWTWAVDLQTREVCLVPAALVYPILRHLNPESSAQLGVGSGMSWAEAICRGLLSVCRTLTITQLATAQQPYPEVDLMAVAQPEGTWQRHFLRTRLRRTKVYDVTGPLQVPTLAMCVEGQAIVYTTHVDRAQALQDGLEQMSLRRLSSGERTLLESLSAVPDLPVSLRGQKTTLPTYQAPQQWPERQIWLRQAIEKQGWRAFAVPLDHDVALSKIQPYIARVLVARAESL